jgi:hypothetical protein
MKAPLEAMKALKLMKSGVAIKTPEKLMNKFIAERTSVVKTRARNAPKSMRVPMKAMKAMKALKAMNLVKSGGTIEIPEKLMNKFIAERTSAMKTKARNAPKSMKGPMKTMKAMKALRPIGSGSTSKMREKLMDKFIAESASIVKAETINARKPMKEPVKGDRQYIMKEMMSTVLF